LPKPLSQVESHLPAVHDSVPMWVLLQARAQAPQWLVEVFVLASQPSLYVVLQSANGAVQEATVHALATQPATPLATEQEVAQEPQCAVSVAMLTSQPSAYVELQSSWSASHEATVQALEAHPAVPLATVQVVLQPPQCAGSLVVLISQPLVCLLLSQLSKPVSQVPTHTLPAHTGVVMWLLEQTVPQAPQWFASVASVTSQPVVCLLLSQSA
jgi:hypothetical protein